MDSFHKLSNPNASTNKETEQITKETADNTRQYKFRLCPNCGSEIDRNHFFCTSCGAKIEAETLVLEDGCRFCVNCGHPLSLTSSFCSVCGTKTDF